MTLKIYLTFCLVSNSTNIEKISILHCVFFILDTTRLAIALLAMATNSMDKRSVHDAIFILK